MASEWRIVAFQCAFLWVSAHTEGQWMRNQHLYKTLFLAHSPPPSPFSLLLLPPNSVPLPPRCHSVEVEESIGGLFEMQAQVWEHWAWEKKKNPFLFGLNGGIWKTGRFFGNSFSSRPRRLSVGQKHCCHSGKNKASLPPNLIEFRLKKKKKKYFVSVFFCSYRDDNCNDPIW